jgi:hypothetical protein
MQAERGGDMGERMRYEVHLARSLVYRHLILEDDGNVLTPSAPLLYRPQSLNCNGPRRPPFLELHLEAQDERRRIDAPSKLGRKKCQ